MLFIDYEHVYDKWNTEFIRFKIQNTQYTWILTEYNLH